MLLCCQNDLWLPRMFTFRKCAVQKLTIKTHIWLRNNSFSCHNVWNLFLKWTKIVLDRVCFTPKIINLQYKSQLLLLQQWIRWLETAQDSRIDNILTSVLFRKPTWHSHCWRNIAGGLWNQIFRNYFDSAWDGLYSCRMSRTFACTECKSLVWLSINSKFLVICFLSSIHCYWTVERRGQSFAFTNGEASFMLTSVIGRSKLGAQDLFLRSPKSQNTSYFSSA